MTAPLSVAVIGAGNIAGAYDSNRRDGETGIYSHAGAYREHGGFTLTTVFDPAPGRTEEFRRAWQVERGATSLSDILERQHDVVSVCSPDDSHFPVLEALLSARCCRTILVEKPLALRLEDIGTVARLAERNSVNLVCNFQRRFETAHLDLRRRIQDNPGALLSVTGHYMKGLHHIGTTMVDTLVHLCGDPQAVLALGRVFNAEVEDYSYEFVLYYPGFTVVVKTTDSERFTYNYHVFELDLLFSDGRAALVDISQGVRESPVTGYAYSGVKVLNDKESRYRETAYNRSMVAVAGYVHDVTTGRREHTVNTPQSSYTNALIVSRIIESYERGLVRLNFGTQQWTR